MTRVDTCVQKHSVHAYTPLQHIFPTFGSGMCIDIFENISILRHPNPNIDAGPEETFFVCVIFLPHKKKRTASAVQTYGALLRFLDDCRNFCRTAMSCLFSTILPTTVSFFASLSTYAETKWARSPDIYHFFRCTLRLRWGQRGQKCNVDKVWYHYQTMAAKATAIIETSSFVAV